MSQEADTLSPPTLTMCYHLVTYCRYECGHQVQTRRHYIDCNRTACRISVRHKRHEHDCPNECDQEMLVDQHLVMDRNRNDCDACCGIVPTTVAEGVNGTNGDDDSGEETSDADSDR
ncbi:uncharacterized protein B0H18DRAFT_436884 [Fomitopsis serialis]|uniref:uncharacterized protein n=1 Tax=Fomitopsis serialis TaxID=139415 RepID=UPI002008708B|nr:uncharacterized protein B0H18DRAFT_436884 [Neoantrodia serialis]KAH9924150.1 hypothetical protein B0H18DRAFT_436884 [Neoantrodia serialis]